MTGTLWTFTVIAAAVSLLAIGWILGGRHAHRQLERDTGGWKYPPIH